MRRGDGPPLAFSAAPAYLPGGAPHDNAGPRPDGRNCRCAGTGGPEASQTGTFGGQAEPLNEENFPHRVRS